MVSSLDPALVRCPASVGCLVSLFASCASAGQVSLQRLRPLERPRARGRRAPLRPLRGHRPGALQRAGHPGACLLGGVLGAARFGAEEVRRGEEETEAESRGEEDGAELR